MSYLIAIVCLLLAGIVTAELWPASATAKIQAADVPPPLATAAQEAPPVAAWADIALGRPLFAPDRRAPQAGPATQVPLPRLAGTIRTDGSLLAIFQADGAARPLVLGRDAAVAGWTVADIADGAVTLVRGGSSVLLRLGFANQPVVLKPSAPPPAVLLHTKRTDPFLQP